MVIGRIKWFRFAASAGLAGAVSLGMAAAIVLGAMPVGFASDQPIAMTITGGTASGLGIDTGGLSDAGGGSAAATHTFGAKIHMDTATLSNLCIAPEIGIPGTPLQFGLSLRTGDTSRVSDVTIGTVDTQIGRLDLPPTVVASGGALGTLRAPEALTRRAQQYGLSARDVTALVNVDSPVNALQLHTQGRSELGQVAANLYNLKLGHGIDFNSISAGFQIGGRASCK